MWACHAGRLSIQSAMYAIEGKSWTVVVKGISRNVLGGELLACCIDPMMGFYRDGRCETGPEDFGRQVICARMTDAFLAFSKSRGNDLARAAPAENFPRREALAAGVAPPVFLAACHEAALAIVSVAELKAHMLDLN